jgi:hypothetical protein
MQRDFLSGGVLMNYLLRFAFVGALIVILLVIFLTWGPDTTELSETIIVNTPTQSPALLTFQPTVPASPTTHSTAEKSQENTIHFQITDALGDPIHHGQIIINEQIHSFENGLLNCVIPLSDEYILQVQAEGYWSISKKFQDPLPSLISLQAEYTCHFDFVVYAHQNLKRPIEGATVTVRRASSVPRPVADKLKLPVRSIKGERITLTLHRQTDGIIVTSVTPNNMNDPNIAKANDRILSLGGIPFNSLNPTRFPPRAPIMILTHQESLPLRIWDTIAVYADNTYTGGKFDDFIEIQKGNSSIMNFIWRLPFPENDRVVARALTDKEGRCRIDDLAPGIYFAQALYDQNETEPMLIHPERGGYEFYMGISSKLSIRVKRTGIQYLQAGIYNVQIQLKAKNQSSGKGLYLLTSDRSGRAELDSLPRGDYELIVTPPNPFQPTQKTLELTIDKERESVEVEFEGGVRVMGHVLRADTGDPVEGFGLKLYKWNPHGGPYDMGVLATTKSDADGSFLFSNVLPGKYILSSRGSLTYNGFLPDKTTFVQRENATGSERALDSQIRFILQDRDVKGIKFLVLPGVETRFQGKVMTPEGIPISGAEIRLTHTWQIPDATQPRQTQVPFLNESYKSDEKGNFDLYFISTPSEKIHRETIIAIVEEDVIHDAFSPSNLKNERPMRAGWGGWLRRKGTVPIEYRFGDTVKGIRIVAAEIQPYVLTGRVSTEDGNWPIDVNVYAQQKGEMYPAQVNHDGVYHIEFPDSTEVILTASTSTRQIETERFGKKNFSEYSSAFIRIPFLNRDEEMIQNIVLKRAGVLAGKLVNPENKPIEGVEVKAFAMENNYIVSVGTRKTLSDGLFWVDGLRMDLNHTINVTIEDATAPIYQKNGFFPDHRDLVIMIDPSQIPELAH